jgi:recombination protein RecA
MLWIRKEVPTVAKKKTSSTGTKEKSSLEKAKEEQQGVERIQFETDIVDWISTTCTVLDLAIADCLPGGVPTGRMIRIYGGESSCKSVIVQALLGSIQRKGGIGFYGDIERTFSSDFSENFGLDPYNEDTFRLYQPSEEKKKENIVTIEDLFDVYLKGVFEVEDERNKLIVVDTVTMLPTVAEKKAPLKKGTFGTKPKLISTALRKYSGIFTGGIVGSHTLVFVDQSRADIASPVQGKEKAPGGKAPNFYPSVIVLLKKRGIVKNKRGDQLKTWVGFKVEKNKVGMAGRGGMFLLDPRYGIDDVASNLMFFSELQNDKKTLFTQVKNSKGEFPRYPSATIDIPGLDKKKKSMVVWIKFIEKNKLEGKLRELVYKKWKELFAPEDRKKRVFE